jgi:hypothetical protein
METCAAIKKIQCSSSLSSMCRPSNRCCVYMLLYYALLAADVLYSYMCRPSNRCCVYMLLTYALLAADMLYLLLTYCSLCRGKQQLPFELLVYAAV